MPRLACAFCPNLASKSGEHIFDDWLNRINGKRIRNTYEFVETGRGDIETRRYKAKSINITRPVVCERCNNGWMSEITNDAKKTLEGCIRYHRAVTLLPLGVLTISAFTFLKACVLDQSLDSKPFFLPSVRAKFRDTCITPDGVQIWMACYRNPDRTSGHTWHHTIKLHSGRFSGFDIFVFTYMIGYVTLQLTAFRWTKQARFKEAAPCLVPADFWNKATVPIWPYQSPVLWPPEQYLDSRALELFRDRFSRLRTLK